MKALVTGGAGFIGSNMVDGLLNKGYEVTVIDNESSDAHDHFYWNSKTNNHKLDICDYEATRKLYDGVDYVFHFAAEARIQPSILNPIKAATTNFVGTCTVLQCAREAGVKRVMYSSTSSAYGLKNNPPLNETMPNDCLNPYSVSKSGGEELCKMYSSLFGLQTVVFRYFNVYGEGMPISGAYRTVLSIFGEQYKKGLPLTFTNDGEQRRDFTYVQDVVSANLLAAEYEHSLNGEVFNVGNGYNYSVNEVINMFGSESAFLENRIEPKTTLADNSKLRKTFGWEPTGNLPKFIEQYKKTLR